jgi:hypothetical protein
MNTVKLKLTRCCISVTVLTWQQCLIEKYKERILANRLSCLHSTARQQTDVHYICSYYGVRICTVFQVHTRCTCIYTVLYLLLSVVTGFSGTFAFRLLDLLVLKPVTFPGATALFVLHICFILYLFSTFSYRVCCAMVMTGFVEEA